MLAELVVEAATVVDWLVVVVVVDAGVGVGVGDGGPGGGVEDDVDAGAEVLVTDNVKDVAVLEGVDVRVVVPAGVGFVGLPEMVLAWMFACVMHEQAELTASMFSSQPPKSPGIWAGSVTC